MGKFQVKYDAQLLDTEREMVLFHYRDSGFVQLHFDVRMKCATQAHRASYPVRLHWPERATLCCEFENVGFDLRSTDDSDRQRRALPITPDCLCRPGRPPGSARRDHRG